MIRAIARSEREFAGEGAIHEERHCENDDRNGNLPTDQEGAPPAAAASRSDAIAGLHDRGQIRSCALKRWNEAEDQRACERYQQAEDQRTAIHLESERDREIRRNLNLPKQQHARISDAETNDAASNRKEQALRNQLTHQAPASGAD